MNTAIFFCLLGAVAAAPERLSYDAPPPPPPPGYGAPSGSGGSFSGGAGGSFSGGAGGAGGVSGGATVLKDERVMEDDKYSFDFETSDGIVRSEAGEPGSTEDGAFEMIGQYSFPLPDGQIFEMKFVADENGFQPESSFLPVAPAFPHPIPDFVLAQIEKARLEDEAAAANQGSSSGSANQGASSGSANGRPSSGYAAPPQAAAAANGYA